MLPDAGRDPDAARVGPGQELELRPPALDDQGDVEAQDERHGDQTGKAVAVDDNVLKMEFG